MSKYISIPQPTPTDTNREIEAIFFPLPLGSKPYKVVMSVPKSGVVRTLKEWIASRFENIDADRVQVCDVWNHRVFRVLSAASPLTEAIRTSDIYIIMMFETEAAALPPPKRTSTDGLGRFDHTTDLSQPNDETGAFVLELLLGKRVKQTSSFTAMYKPPLRFDLYGNPFVLTFTKETTNKDIYRTVAKVVSRFLRAEHTSNKMDTHTPKKKIRLEEAADYPFFLHVTDKTGGSTDGQVQCNDDRFYLSPNQALTVEIIEEIYERAVDKNEIELAAVEVLTSRTIEQWQKIATLMAENADLKRNASLLTHKFQELLHVDAACGEVVTFMLNFCGAAADDSDEDGMTALVLASKHGLKEVVSVLIMKADLNKQTKEGMTALMEAAKNNHLEVVQALASSGADLNITTNENMTALMFASINGHSEIVRFLISKNISINVCNQTGETALTLAIQHERLEIMQLLLEKRAAVNTQNTQGQSPLMIALNMKFLEGVSLLLKFNPENQLEIQEVNGETALIMASTHGQQECVSMFLHHGADIWARTFQGFTAKFVANRFGHIVIEDMLNAWERKNPQKFEPKFDNMDTNLSIAHYLQRINLPHLTDFFVDNLLMETLGEFKNLSQRRRSKIEQQLLKPDLDTINMSLEAMGIFIQKFVSLLPIGQVAGHTANSKENETSVKDAPA